MGAQNVIPDRCVAAHLGLLLLADTTRKPSDDMSLFYYLFCRYRNVLLPKCNVFVLHSS